MVNVTVCCDPVDSQPNTTISVDVPVVANDNAEKTYAWRTYHAHQKSQVILTISGISVKFKEARISNGKFEVQIFVSDVVPQSNIWRVTPLKASNLDMVKSWESQFSVDLPITLEEADTATFDVICETGTMIQIDVTYDQRHVED